MNTLHLFRKTAIKFFINKFLFSWFKHKNRNKKKTKINKELNLENATSLMVAKIKIAYETREIPNIFEKMYPRS
jgi:hypothetical protein